MCINQYTSKKSNFFFFNYKNYVDYMIIMWPIDNMVYLNKNININSLLDYCYVYTLNKLLIEKQSIVVFINIL